MKNIKFILTALLLLGILVSCTKENRNNNYPECLQSSIDFALRNPPTTPRASITKYLYNSEEVFDVSVLNIPDGGNSYRTANCEIICGSGGIDGGTTCTENFINELTFVEIVWKDPR